MSDDTADCPFCDHENYVSPDYLSDGLTIISDMKCEECGKVFVAEADFSVSWHGVEPSKESTHD